ncbi:hypothetical protein MHTCC0001_23520 [Flavobacteriaceae bacterium MHTCC 0001]
MDKNRVKQISELIYKAIKGKEEAIKVSFNTSKAHIGFFYIDDVLPREIALELSDIFPKKSEMRCLKSIREYKYISAQMNQHDSILEDTIYAFQEKKVVKLIGDVCNIQSLYADESLYAGGLSLMAKENFLNPHLDNSHDAERERWRVLNLLYYVTPKWELAHGGNLELWPNGLKKAPIVIESKFNRLVVMATHGASWHSVNKVLVDNERRCISNYYFSDTPLKQDDAFHVTKYKGRPEDTFKNIILNADASLTRKIHRYLKKRV